MKCRKLKDFIVKKEQGNYFKISFETLNTIFSGYVQVLGNVECAEEDALHIIDHKEKALKKFSASTAKWAFHPGKIWKHRRG